MYNSRLLRRTRLRCEIASTFFLLTAGAAMPAHAQTSQPPAAAPADGGSDIVVTALRRDTTLQTTPMAITALTGETLTNAGVTNIADYAKFVPALRIQDNGPGQRRVSLRGVQASGEATVGVYYDDTPVTGSVGVSSDAAGRTADFTLFDVNRIEVLRGPQGTLYGASSMGGAIRVIFNKPSQDYEGKVEGQMQTTKGGGFGYFVNGMVNVPLVPDLLAARAILYRRDSNGYVDNSFLGRKNVNDYTATGGRLMLRFTPAPNFTLDATAAFENTDAVSASWNPLVGDYKSAAQIVLPYTDKSQLYSLTAAWDMGGATLTSISSYQHRKSAYAADDSYYIGTYRTEARCAAYVNGDANSPCSSGQLTGYYGYIDSLSPAAIYYPGSTKDFTQEVRLSSSGESAFDWTIGGFYQNRKNDVTSEDARADKASGEIIMPVEIFYRREIFDKLKQVAVFGEGTYHVTPALSLTAGIRYFDYSKTVSGFTDIGWTLIGAPVRPLNTVDSSENGTLLKFNASWQANADMLFYATASQGFRPGGANQVIGLSADLTPYESDKLWNYEVGTKLSLLGRKLTLNLAAFQIDWDNMQVSGRTTNGAFSFLSNAGAARIRGLEAEAFLRPAEGLTLNLAGNYLDAKLTEDQVNDSVVAAGRAGDRIPFIPHFSGSFGVEYRMPVSSSVDFFARGDVNYVGASYSEFRATNIYRVKMEDYALANVRVGFELPESDTGVYLFVNNIFDSVAINRASMSSTPNSYSATSAAPRTVGVNLRRHF
ncbi:outer membrane receptor protein involved in Fe transport [Sphingobium wenxiniae]|uniref:Ligand-gated channel protein n=2 Tax=Sphingobium TaxID=165695 RepID=T0GER8_9SPHN|nr:MULTISPECIES: TonB-dependent receptor [Sphingobium]EQA99161.1 ligand-gated channel protein [Sphingobium baderi LL03]KMS61400.1 ligand-gated channel protein [Sphingobium baderi LL03]MBB6193724.1 outer membrane receptor protein involved in Fe transport [Sphingobium wenxiniae]TWH96709.1 outer membrane receptor protein involved in Fe transport [Sphingobium wenxiniae]